MAGSLIGWEQKSCSYMVVRSHNARPEMDIYNAWFDLKAGVSDVELSDRLETYSSRREPVEGVHFGVNSQVQNVQFALYRDFPDSVRHRGDEKF